MLNFIKITNSEGSGSIPALGLTFELCLFGQYGGASFLLQSTHGASTMKHYKFVMYRKWTDVVVS